MISIGSYGPCRREPPHPKLRLVVFELMESPIVSELATYLGYRYNARAYM